MRPNTAWELEAAEAWYVQEQRRSAWPDQIIPIPTHSRIIRWSDAEWTANNNEWPGNPDAIPPDDQANNPEGDNVMRAVNMMNNRMNPLVVTETIEEKKRKIKNQAYHKRRAEWAKEGVIRPRNKTNTLENNTEIDELTELVGNITVKHGIFESDKKVYLNPETSLCWFDPTTRFNTWDVFARFWWRSSTNADYMPARHTHYYWIFRRLEMDRNWEKLKVKSYELSEKCNNRQFKPSYMFNTTKHENLTNTSKLTKWVDEIATTSRGPQVDPIFFLGGVATAAVALGLVATFIWYTMNLADFMSHSGMYNPYISDLEHDNHCMNYPTTLNISALNTMKLNPVDPPDIPKYPTEEWTEMRERQSADIMYEMLEESSEVRGALDEMRRAEGKFFGHELKDFRRK